MIKYGIDSEKTTYGKTSGATFIQALDVLKKYLTPEGFEVVVKFAQSATGVNRTWILGTLISLYTKRIQSITKTELRSYANTNLFKLFETGDLKEIKRGVVVPGKYVAELSNDDQVKEFLRVKASVFISNCIAEASKKFGLTAGNVGPLLIELVDEELKNF